MFERGMGVGKISLRPFDTASNWINGCTWLRIFDIFRTFFTWLYSVLHLATCLSQVQLGYKL